MKKKEKIQTHTVRTLPDMYQMTIDNYLAKQIAQRISTGISNKMMKHIKVMADNLAGKIVSCYHIELSTEDLIAGNKTAIIIKLRNKRELNKLFGKPL